MLSYGGDNMNKKAMDSGHRKSAGGGAVAEHSGDVSGLMKSVREEVVMATYSAAVVAGTVLMLGNMSRNLHLGNPLSIPHSVLYLAFLATYVLRHRIGTRVNHRLKHSADPIIREPHIIIGRKDEITSRLNECPVHSSTLAALRFKNMPHQNFTMIKRFNDTSCFISRSVINHHQLAVQAHRHHHLPQGFKRSSKMLRTIARYNNDARVHQCMK